MTKYLIIGPSWIGDMIMANALFRLLKRQEPTCLIDVLAPAWSHPVIERMPEVRRPILMPLKHGMFGVMHRYRIGKSLRAEGYDHAIVLPNSWKSALIPFFANIPRRTGWRGECRYGLLNDLRILNKKKLSLMVQRYLSLGASALGSEVESDALSFYYPRLNIDERARKMTIKTYGLSSETPLIILCPGAQYGHSKRWPEGYFAAVADYYLKKGWQVALLGGKAEKDLVVAIEQLISDKSKLFFDLTSTDLIEAIDIMSLAKAVVSNDSGLMHLACALERPTIAIYGSSSPDFTPPLSKQAVILSRSLPCKPCFKRECPLGHLHCLKMIRPEEVINAIQQFF